MQIITNWSAQAVGKCIKKLYFHGWNSVLIYTRLMPFIQEELYLKLLEINRTVSGYVWNCGSD